MYELLTLSTIISLIGFLGFIVTIFQVIFNLIKRRKKKKGKQLIVFLSLALFGLAGIGIFAPPVEKQGQTDTKIALKTDQQEVTKKTEEDNTTTKKPLIAEGKKGQKALTPTTKKAVITDDEDIDEDDPDYEEEIEDKEENDTNTFVKATVTRVVDGDTIVIDTGEKVRFILVDTPETKHPNKGVEYFGKESSDFTTAQLEGKTVYLEKDVSETDKYGRLLRYVWTQRPSTDTPTDEEIKSYCFNAVLLAEGYAQVATFPPDLKYVDIFRTMETAARDNNMGLWADGGKSFVAKTDPNKGKNNQQQSQKKQQAQNNNAAAAKKDFPSDKQENKPPINSTYVGNKNTHKFHYSHCKSAEDMKVSNRVELNSREDAINQGYKPCKRCNP